MNAGELESGGSAMLMMRTRFAAVAACLLLGLIGGQGCATRMQAPWITSGIGMELMPVEAGNFMMGSEDENPIHEVQISHAYWIGKTEVTHAQWQAIMGNKRSYRAGEDSTPVVQISWGDAVSFCKKLTERERAAGRLPEGYVYRLPTEAEWEYAARGGNKSQGYTYSGSNNLDDVAWFKDNSDSNPHPVGQKKPNELGIYDMSGNVLEWCRDRYGHYPLDPAIDPQGARMGLYVIRSGCWNDGSICGRVTTRFNAAPSIATDYLGFRVCLGYGELTSGVVAAPPPPPPKMETVQPLPQIIPELGMELLPISAGEFQMGSAEAFAAPIHKVTITHMYWMGKTEVTQSQWQAIMDNNPSEFQSDNENNPDVFQGDNRPVEMVSWNDCVEFCQKLTEHERAADRLPDGYVYRLPTEAEWEFAARGGNRSGGFTYSGSNKLDEVAWCGSNFNDGGATQPVGQLRPNELGLYDMIGNVSEWCHDRSGEYPAAHVTDPIGPDLGFDDRIMRGGSWCSHAEVYTTPAFRGNWDPDGTDYDIGLRVVLAPPIPADQPSK